MPPDKDKVKSLLSKGSQITGASAGGTAGFLLGGPVGAALGGPLGLVFTNILSEMANRVLSNREEIRVGATARFALTKIKSRIKCGNKLRNDGFFEEKKKGRTDAEEIFEGVLLKAKNEHEEKKTKILGNIFANVAFFPSFSVGEANHLLRIAENLTYREMCILSLIRRKHEIGGIRLSSDWLGEEYLTGEASLGYSVEKASVLQQAYELCNYGLAFCSTGKKDVTASKTILL